MGDDVRRETMEVPAGGRYRVNECGCELTASDKTDMMMTVTGAYRSLSVAAGRPACKKVQFVTHWGIYAPKCTYLGGPQESTEAATPAVTVPPAPATCSGPCLRTLTSDRHCVKCDPRARRLAHTCKHGKVGLCLECTPVAPRRLTPDEVHPYNVAAKHGAELHDHGVPRTALEAIQSRKKPAPWVPSVDEFDLLPDAPGTFRSGR